MTPRNIYHFPFPIYSQQTLDVAAVYENAGQFKFNDGRFQERVKSVETMSSQARDSFINSPSFTTSYEKRFLPFLVDVLSLFHIDIPRFFFRAKITFKKH